MPRPKGVPNRRTKEAVELLDSLGCDPLEGMARIALDENHPIELRARMFAELAPYVRPKLSAQKVDASVEHSGDIVSSLLQFVAGKTVAPTDPHEPD
jgi:hypothetical protein